MSASFYVHGVDQVSVSKANSDLAPRFTNKS